MPFLRSSRCAGVTPIVALFLLAPAPAADAGPVPQCGKASWYEHTSRTASGERADPEALAAAHPSLPFGTHVIVKNLRNGHTVEVRINDRGPHTGGRIIDVTRAAARKLGLAAAGVGRVRITLHGQNGASGALTADRIRTAPNLALSRRLSCEDEVSRPYYHH